MGGRHRCHMGQRRRTSRTGRIQTQETVSLTSLAEFVLMKVRGLCETSKQKRHGHCERNVPTDLCELEETKVHERLDGHLIQASRPIIDRGWAEKQATYRVYVVLKSQVGR